MSVNPSTYVLEFSGAADTFVVTTNDITVVDIWVTNQDADTRYLMAFDLTAAPGNGTTPVYSVAVQPGLTSGHAFERGAHFQNGLVLALSSTPATLTATVGGQGLFGALVRGYSAFGDV